MALKAEGLSGRTFSDGEMWDAVWCSGLRLFGEVGVSELGLFVVRGFDAPSGVLVIRCWHTALERVRGAVAAVTEVAQEQAAVRVLCVSGTLKRLRQKLGK